ncbi:MAG: hypothetical protein QM747_08520 [Nocardioides sp.]
MTIQTMTLDSFHVVYLDWASGCGALVLPPESEDVYFERGHPTAHEAALVDLMGVLAAMGWELTDGDFGPPCLTDGDLGGMCLEGFTADGRAVVGLYGLHPSDPELAHSVDGIGEAFAAIHRMVGLV